MQKGKFLFDINNFDEPDEEISEEDLIPTFTEEELEAARKDGYDTGKQAGIAEEKAARDTRVAQHLGHIVQAYQTLVTAESLREKQYEEEALRLLHRSLRTLFPKLNQKLELAEIEHLMERIVQSASGKTKMIIHVPADIHDNIEEFIASKLHTNDSCLLYTSPSPRD